MSKIRAFLIYFFVSVVIFVLIFIFANSPLGVKRVPAPEIMPGLPAIVGRWHHETNPIFYLATGISSSGPPYQEKPFLLLYWYFLSLLITFLLYKIMRLRRLKLRSTKYLASLIVIIIGIIAYSIYWHFTTSTSQILKFL